MNKEVIKIGEKIHNALREYASTHNDCWAWGDDLCGACAVGAHMLARTINKKLGKKAKFVATDGHCFVEYGGYIYDPTATQFGRQEKVFAVKKKDANKLQGYEPRCYYTTYKQHGVAWVNRTWGRSQTPKAYKLKWDNKGRKAKVEYIA